MTINNFVPLLKWLRCFVCECVCFFFLFRFIKISIATNGFQMTDCGNSNITPIGLLQNGKTLRNSIHSGYLIFYWLEREIFVPSNVFSFQVDCAYVWDRTTMMLCFFCFFFFYIVILIRLIEYSIYYLLDGQPIRVRTHSSIFAAYICKPNFCCFPFNALSSHAFVFDTLFSLSCRHVRQYIYIYMSVCIHGVYTQRFQGLTNKILS